MVRWDIIHVLFNILLVFRTMYKVYNAFSFFFFEMTNGLDPFVCKNTYRFFSEDFI